MNEEYDRLILKLNSNVQKIILLYEEEKGKNLKISQELNTVTEKLNIYKDKYQELEQKYNNLKLARLFTGTETEEKDARFKLNKIIREIDNCIALLNK
ncbi:MAG: hypothetical protein LBQ22_03805 [Bacteroidales bacterium]|jgi:hypothetical protein|nr:hypothetical protein [Bacteroidales bacterium]